MRPMNSNGNIAKIANPITRISGPMNINASMTSQIQRNPPRCIRWGRAHGGTLCRVCQLLSVLYELYIVRVVACLESITIRTVWVTCLLALKLLLLLLLLLLSLLLLTLCL